MTNIVITGGASGLGLAMAKRWARAGADIFLVDRNEDQADTAIMEVEKLGAKAHFVRCDVTSEADIAELTSTITRHWNSIDVLINSAGVPTAGSVEAESIEVWQWVLDINLMGTVRVTKALAPLLRRQGHGHIVNVASQAGLTPMPMMGSYNATKAAVVAFSETLRLEMAPFGVGVSVLCPAFVNTNLDKSLPAEQNAMQDVVTKLVQKGTVSADAVASMTYQAVQANRFLIVTHKFERRIYRLKRWLPKVYEWLMCRRTRVFTLKGYQQDG